MGRSPIIGGMPMLKECETPWFAPINGMDEQSSYSSYVDFLHSMSETRWGTKTLLTLTLPELPLGLYAPIVRRTLAKGGKILALNVSTELKDKWKKSRIENSRDGRCSKDASSPSYQRAPNRKRFDCDKR